jgi:tetratricopeptide (TPR) repeat protein
MRTPAALAAMLSLAATSGAQAAVTVFGGGMAQQCSAAARDGAVDDAAEQACTMALEGELLGSRDRAGTYVNRGIIKLRRKQYAQAVQDFDTAIKTNRDLSEAYVNRGAAYIGARRFTEAVVDFNTALQMGVTEPHKAYYNRGVANEWLDDPKGAYLDYQKALELAPDWSLPKQQLARFGVSKPAAPVAKAP